MTDQIPLKATLAKQVVLPILSFQTRSEAVPAAKALVNSGLPAMEVLLRTEAALEAIYAIANEVPQAVVGAGTVLNARQYELAVKAGAKFAISPGSTSELLKAANDGSAPLLPGVATASETMTLLEAGFTFLKFFPAESSGGYRYLSALASPLPTVQFCPTGGITAANLSNYLTTSNVIAAGISTIAPPALLAESQWHEIERRARDIVSLASIYSKDPATW